MLACLKVVEREPRRFGSDLVHFWSKFGQFGSDLGPFGCGVGSGPGSGLAVRWSTLGSEAGLLIFRGQIL